MSTGTGVKLYEVADTYLLALTDLAQRDDLPAEVIADTLEAVKGEVEVKAANVAAFVKNVEVEAEVLKQRAAALSARAKKAATVADGLKAYLAMNLLRCQVKEVKTGDIHVRLVKNPPAVQITELSLVPAEFKRTPAPEPPPEPVPDKIAIAAALKGGLPVEGCTLIQSYRVSID
jgi:hypothetical protein